MISTHPSLVEQRARRQRLVDAVAQLAAAIASGEVTPEPIELQALAEICEREQLDAETARVRRWLGEETARVRRWWAE